MNSVAGLGNKLYFATATTFHALAFMYMSYFFRFRRVGAAPIVALAVGYNFVFDSVNQILYGLLVDRAIVAEARNLGLGRHVYHEGQNRNINYI